MRRDLSNFDVSYERHVEISRLGDHCIEIGTILYFPRRLTNSATRKKGDMEVRKVWKGIVVVEEGDWSPLLAFLHVLV